MHRALKFIPASACLLVCGCPPPNPVTPTPAGATDRSLTAIVQTINSNNAQIDRPLYASPVQVSAKFIDDRGRPHSYILEGGLLVRCPSDFRLDLRHSLSEPVMQVAANADEFWLWIRPEAATYWWGRFANVGKPCMDPMPLRPDELADVLGMRPLPTASDGAVGPARIFGERYDRLIYLRKENDAYAVEREYWVEREPPYLIRLILFRDAVGRRGMNAFLDDYRPAWTGGPLVAHKISVYWPQKDGRMEEGRLILSIDRWTEPGRISARAFVRPTSAPEGISRTVQVDADCEGASPTSTPAADRAGRTSGHDQ
jgi:hypothetical protein